MITICIRTHGLKNCAVGDRIERVWSRRVAWYGIVYGTAPHTVLLSTLVLYSTALHCTTQLYVRYGKLVNFH